MKKYRLVKVRYSVQFPPRIGGDLRCEEYYVYSSWGSLCLGRLCQDFSGYQGSKGLFSSGAFARSDESWYLRMLGFLGLTPEEAREAVDNAVNDLPDVVLSDDGSLEVFNQVVDISHDLQDFEENLGRWRESYPAI